MLQKRRRTLTLEHLEDRLVPTGFATAVQDIFTGAIFITMDGNSPGIQALQTTPGVLSVAPLPGTLLNGVATGTPVNFSLPSVSNINVTAGNGSNRIFLGQNALTGAVAGFAIPGNIDVEVGNGVDTVVLNKITTNTGQFIFNGTHGPGGTGTDTVTMTDTLTGANIITPGRRKLTLSQTNITTGADLILAARAQLASDSIRITNSTFHPAPRLHAIGLLTITDGNANNSFFLDTIDVGTSTIVSGTGNNTLTFSHSTILTDTTILGTEAAGAKGSNTVVMDTDKILGQFVNMRILDESGVSGVNEGGAAVPAGQIQTANTVGARGQVHINHVTLNAIQFSNAFPVATPQLNVRVDDGDYYYDVVHGNAVNGSTFVATSVGLPGLMNVDLGDHFKVVQLGNIGAVTKGIPGATTVGNVRVGELQVRAENDLDTVIVAADVNGLLIPSPFSPVPFILPAAEIIDLGDNTINPVQGTAFPAAGANGQLAPPSVFTSGTVGNSVVQGNMDVRIGNNLSIPGFVNGNNAGEPLGWPVKLTNNVIGSVVSFFESGFATGNLNFVPTTQSKLETGQNGVASPGGTDNGLAVLFDPMSVGGDLNIFMGSGGFSHRESLVLNGVTAGNIFAQLNSDGTEIPDGNPNLGVYIGIDHTLVTDNMFGDIFTGSAPGLTLNDIGHGADMVFTGEIPAENSFALPTTVFGFGVGPSKGASDALTVNGFLFMTLSDSGINSLTAHNTTCAFGIVDGGGGAPAFNIFIDDGGNFGFIVVNFN